MLRRVVETAYHRMGLDPDKELAELESCVEHSRPERKDHLVRIEDVETILLCEVGSDGLDPRAGESTVLGVGLKVIILDDFVLLERLESLFALDQRNTVRRVADHCLDFVRTDEPSNEFLVATVSARKEVITQLPDGTGLN